MAMVRIPDENRILRDPTEGTEYLARIGIEYARWEPAHSIEPGAASEEILGAYGAEIEKLKRRGGYVTADVIDVNPETPNLEAMLAKFNREHWHDEDEVRFIVHGRGLFHIHPPEGPVFSIEVEKGDMIKVPQGTHHWFDLCSDRTIRAVRLFQNVSGWSPNYTGTGMENGYQPLCFGPMYMPV